MFAHQCGNRCSRRTAFLHKTADVLAWGGVCEAKESKELNVNARIQLRRDASSLVFGAFDTYAVRGVALSLQIAATTKPSRIS
jgi:hypothetical protein